MRTLSLALLISISLIPFLALGQNNPIFGGSNADGYSRTRISNYQVNQIYPGGIEDGYAVAQISNVPENGFIDGGKGDGYGVGRYVPVDNNSIFDGGWDDGGDIGGTSSITNNSIFDGGPDDGYDVIQIDVYEEAIGPFPVQLLSFDAIKRDDYVQLVWVTTQEINLDRFEVERADKTGSFQFLLQQSPLGGPGEAAEYQREDLIPLIGRSYYRLRSIDLDGSEAYSQTVEIIFDNISGIALTLFPNPTNGEATLQVNSGHDETTTLQIYDLLGRAISVPETSLQLSPGNTHQLSVADQPEGIYLINISGPALARPIVLKLQKR